MCLAHIILLIINNLSSSSTLLSVYYEKAPQTCEGDWSHCMQIPSTEYLVSQMKQMTLTMYCQAKFVTESDAGHVLRGVDPVIISPAQEAINYSGMTG